MSLANKYRPKDFDWVIWQEHIIDILKAKLSDEQNTHTNYLFFWPRWTWKTSSARILSRALNCTNLKNWNPCNKCDNCKLILEWKTLDYIEIDAASHTWVDNIREEILDKVAYPPTSLKKKIYVIDEVHMLSKWAFNALLKTIEEPNDNVCFIFATTEIHKIPDTIISRCQVFNFKKVNNEKIITRLESICKQENIKYTKDAFDIIAKISEWCLRDAIKYLDQVNILWEITPENVSKLLWVASNSLIESFLKTIKSSNINNIFSEIDKIYKQWINMIQFSKQIILYLDENFTSNLDFNFFMANKITEILSKIKYYPYPNVLYKLVFGQNLFLKNNNSDTFNEKTIQNNEKTTNNVNQNIKNNTTIQEKNIEQSQNNKVKWNKNNKWNEIIKQITPLIKTSSLKLAIRQVILKEIKDNVFYFTTNWIIHKKTIEKNKEEFEKKLWDTIWKNVKIDIEYIKWEDMLNMLVNN